MTTDAWGIQHRYLDSADVEHGVADASVARLRAVIGEAPAELDDTAPLVLRPGAPFGPAEVQLEQGGTLRIEGALPPDMPLGYHRVDGRLLIVSPGRCHQPAGRAWGWAVQLYAARSGSSWGIGDLADLATLTDWAAGNGAGFLLVNPLHAVAPTSPQQASPYFPSSRRFRNPIYLRVPGTPDAALQQAPIDRDAIWAAKRAALWQMYETGSPAAEFGAWRSEQGEALEQFATWCALAEQHGAAWRSWPSGAQRPATAVADAHAVTFHAWLQYLTAMQLASATRAITVIQDLPVGVDPEGMDAWAWQDVMAQGVTVGAPADPFNTAGQGWGLPPFVPWRLRQAEYRPFIESIRATIAGAGGLRVDHVMGLFRLWWIPDGMTPADGAYVRYPYEDLLDIVALESVRAGAVVVGEDLGTVEDGVRESLQEHGILTYRLLWFEDDEPPTWPATAMAAITTHDLPTVAGLWTGADLDDQAESGVAADADATTALRTRLRDWAGLADEAPVQDVTVAAHRLLAQAPSTLVTATLDDALGALRRPNMPGTTERDNWSIPLPALLEELMTADGPRRVADALGSAGLP